MSVEIARKISEKHLSNVNIFSIVGGRKNLTEKTVNLLPPNSGSSLIQAAYLLDVVEVAGVGVNNLLQQGISKEVIDIIHGVSSSRREGAEVMVDSVTLLEARTKAFTTLSQKTA